ncbi:serpin family protein [Butyrivibrio sp. INlla16]|uniref:serpin family protein n=1 Tax=Butyrivibrio sp. INlla16 TaxID=1520807 RepID=UPI00088A3050|nr:serpin family protein [Butyrivibrio sp. INlla16]SDB54258.1 Serine protease inhibitor [Butyrivibrio sp. INlla16]
MLDKKKKFNDYYDEITSKFAEQLVAETNNVVFSPYSIASVLLLLSEAVDGDAKEELSKLLNGSKNLNYTQDEIVAFAKAVAKNVEFHSTSAVAVNEDYAETIKDEYKKRINKILGAKVFSSDNMVEDINAWVKENTNGMVEAIANEENMKNVLMCMLNAVAFEAEWRQMYESTDVEYGDFHNADGSCDEIVLLRSTEDEYVENKDFAGFIKPYLGNEFIYMALLPKNEKADMKKLLRNNGISQLYKNKKHGDIIVKMPEFNYEFETNLKKSLEDFGVYKVFGDNADFSPMSSAHLRMDEIKHKALIKVDRNGTKAAAVTCGDTGAGDICLLEDFREITLDRPFVYAIIHADTELPIFVGVTNEIKNAQIEINEKNLDMEGFEPKHYEFRTLEERYDMCCTRYDEIEEKIRPVIEEDPINNIRLRRISDQMHSAMRNSNIRELDAINYTVNNILGIAKEESSEVCEHKEKIDCRKNVEGIVKIIKEKIEEGN